MSFTLVSEALTIAVILPSFAVGYTEGAKNKHFLRAPAVSVLALAAFVSGVLSHQAMYLKIGAGLLTGSLWFLGCRFRDQEQVVSAALLGLCAITILS
jgi:hypothetical protein